MTDRHGAFVEGRHLDEAEHLHLLALGTLVIDIGRDIAESESRLACLKAHSVLWEGERQALLDLENRRRLAAATEEETSR